MILGLLGDIHGNHLALEAVLESAKIRQVEKLLITGDVVGYYYKPKEVLNLLKEWDIELVRGNHEDMLERAISDSSYLTEIGKKYGSGLRVAIEEFDIKTLKFFRNLKQKIVIKWPNLDIMLCHGSPWQTSQYVYPDVNEDVLNKYLEFEADVFVQGHTHYPLFKKIKEKLIINPGSVGQPRNGAKGANWAQSRPL